MFYVEAKLLVLYTKTYHSNLCMVYAGETEEGEREREHNSLQDRLDKELQKLDKRLEQKEV